MHRFTADCENPFCVFVAEGIESQTSEEALAVALLLHQEFCKMKSESCFIGGLPELEITIRNDFPCSECFNSDNDEEDEDECYR